MTDTPPTTVERVRPSVLDSARLAREKRKWTWAWRCGVCPGGYGAAKTESLARQQADAHVALRHPSTTERTDQ